MHRKDLLKKKYRSRGYGGQKTLQRKAMRMKKEGRIKSYRVVPHEGRYELYTR